MGPLGHPCRAGTSEHPGLHLPPPNNAGPSRGVSAATPAAQRTCVPSGPSTDQLREPAAPLPSSEEQGCHHGFLPPSWRLGTCRAQCPGPGARTSADITAMSLRARSLPRPAARRTRGCRLSRGRQACGTCESCPRAGRTSPPQSDVRAPPTHRQPRDAGGGPRHPRRVWRGQGSQSGPCSHGRQAAVLPAGRCRGSGGSCQGEGCGPAGERVTPTVPPSARLLLPAAGSHPRGEGDSEQPAEAGQAGVGHRALGPAA